MSIDKFHTLKDLKETGLKMLGFCISDKGIPILEKYLRPSVISMWDFGNYDDYYTYFDDGIHLVVEVCYRADETTTKSEPLKKDLSNLLEETNK